MNAASWGGVESVKVLLEAGADVNFTYGGKRAIDVIGRGSNEEQVRVLLLKTR